jgi:Uma2 family endonuclease
VSDAPSPRHQSAVADLFRALDAHVTEHALGEMWLAPLDVILDAARALVVQPDLMFVANERSSIVSDRVLGPPDLVIEVLSPSARIGRTEEHLEWLARYGVRECWLVHLERRDVTVVPLADRREDGRRVFAGADPIASGVLPRFDRSLTSMLHRR